MPEKVKSSFTECCHALRYIGFVCAARVAAKRFHADRIASGDGDPDHPGDGGRAVRFAGTTEKANVSAAKTQISLFRTALGLYEGDNGHFPLGSEGGLSALVNNPGGLPNWKTGGYLEQPTVPMDPWGHPYVYQNPGSNGADYDLYSTGADGAQHIDNQH